MMNRLLSRLLALVLLLSLVVSLQTAAATAQEETGSALQYTALGDSLATGLLANQGYARRYAVHLEADLGTEVVLTNLGVPGMVSSELLAALQSEPFVRAAVRRSQIVTWNIGGNDLLAARDQYKAGTCGGDDNQACLRAARDQLQANWTAIVDEIVSLRRPEETILRTMDLYNPFVNEDMASDSWTADGSCQDLDGDGRCTDFEVFKPYLDSVNAHMAATVAARGIPHAPVYRTFNGPQGTEDPEDKGLIAFDGFHPNNQGHQTIADLLRALGYAPLR